MQKSVIYNLNIVFLLTSIISILRLNLKVHDTNDYHTNDTIYEVIQIKKSYYIISDNSNNLILYTESNLIPGQLITVDSDARRINCRKIKNNFCYKEYAAGRGIYYTLNTDEIKVIDNKLNINVLRYKFVKYIETYNHSELLSGILIGELDVNDEIYSNMQKLGILHVFAISGLHVSILFGILIKTLNKNVSIETITIFFMFVLILYFIICDYSISIYRILSTYVLSCIFKHASKTDILKISACIILLYKPYYITNIGFQLSYIISFILIKSELIFKNTKNTFTKLILFNVIIFIATIPIISNINYEMNVFSIIINLLIIPIFTFVIVPISILTLFLNVLIDTFILVENLLFHIIDFLGKFDYLVFNTAYYSLPKAIVFYFIAIKLFKKIELRRFKDALLMVLILVFSMTITKNIFITDNVNILDVDQGNMVHIQTKYNLCNIIIDAGSANNYVNPQDYVQYLKSKGVTKIDAIYLSHNDSDHTSFVSIISNHIQVNAIFVNEFFDNSHTFDVRTIQGNVIHYCGNSTIEIYNPPVDFGSKNDNSMIQRVIINNTKFLFLGDISYNIEEYYIKKTDLSADYVMLGHHGSNTSTSYKSLSEYNPVMAIISCGKNNFYGHPSSNVIALLETTNTDYLVTSENGSIHFNLFYNKVKIEHFYALYSN